MVGRKLVYDDATSYMSCVKEAIGPAKYDEFVKVFQDYTSHRIDYITAFSRVEKILKEYKNLILGFTVFVAPDTKRIAPHTPEATESKYTKIKRAEFDLVNFMNKLETRFRSLDTDVIESFRKIMNKFQERNMSKKKMHKEVVNLLYYHEDLLGDFFQAVCTKTDRWSHIPFN